MTEIAVFILAVAAVLAIVFLVLALSDRHIGGFCLGKNDTVEEPGRTVSTCRKCGTVWVVGWTERVRANGRSK